MTLSWRWRSRLRSTRQPEPSLRRFEAVQSPGDFTDSEAGMEKLDGICMQPIAIGEGLKNLDKVTPTTNPLSIGPERTFWR